MRIEVIKLRDFRNYAALELRPHPGVNLLFGQNGSGKTNLLEAIHYCALGRSHRTSQDAEVVRKGAAMGACGVTVESALDRCEIAVRLTPGEARKKQVYVNRKREARLSGLMGHVRCVIFSPEDLALVREGPATRRRFVDMMLSQLSPAYFVALQRYQKALEQRNAILREGRRGAPVVPEMLEAFEEAMARESAVILPLRRRVIARAAALAAEKYTAISGREGERFAMAYVCCLGDAPEEETQARFLAGIRASRREDLLRGMTCFGLHREDMALTLSGREMKLFASQGQIRTAALSLKLAQLEVFRQECGDQPILLLDDVMSELDMNRRGRLLREIRGAQTFVTCTDESDLEGCDDLRTYRVSLGEGDLAELREAREGEDIPDQTPEGDPDFS